MNRKIFAARCACFLLTTIFSSAYAASAAVCAKCGCNVGHCDKGVPSHLTCSQRTTAEKQVIDKRLEKLKAARKKILADNCNQAIGRLTSALGYKGFEKGGFGLGGGTENMSYQTANEMYEFLPSAKGRQDGWERVTGDEVTQYADAGRLVVGVVHSKNYASGRGPFTLPLDPSSAVKHGHVFEVLPDSQWDSKMNWDNLKIWDAMMNVHAAREGTANNAIKRDFRSFVQFYALTRDY